MKNLLRYIHFKQFEVSEYEKTLRGSHFSDEKQTIRNDQQITDCFYTQRILTEIEEKIYSLLLNGQE